MLAYSSGFSIIDQVDFFSDTTFSLTIRVCSPPETSVLDRFEIVHHETAEDMTINSLPFRAATFLVCITSTIAQQLPYNPTYLVRGGNSKVYIFSPTTSPQFAVYDSTNSINSKDAPEALTNSLPFLSNSSNSFVPVATRNGLIVFSGECSEGDQELDLWTYGFGVNNKTWTQMHTISSDPTLGANFLSAAFSFPDAQQQDVDSMYVFGGMCPNGTNSPSTWTTNAAYSNTMLTISPDKGQDYDVSLTGQRAPPIAEAGLTITPLIPSRLTQDGPPQQQNFVLIGGHTQKAFINMSQVALFSMPEEAWGFIDINQPADTVVEPRSGHTAVMSQDGSRIYVFGGWVGAVNNPATPQLAILEVGAGYGGNGSWSWNVPDQSTVKQYSGDYGVYGHAATMLPGDIMMVTGGVPISSQTGSHRKRQDATFQTKFYNTSSSSWSTTYTNPVTLAATKHSSSGLSSSAKTGLGTGLGIGIVVIIVLLVVLFLLNRQKRKQRAIREKQLREMALGTDRTFSTDGKGASRSVFSGYRSASWGSRQEQFIEGRGSYPPSRQVSQQDVSHDDNRAYGANGLLDVPSPNRGLRTSLRGRAPVGYGPSAYPSSAASGAVFTIEEEEEKSQKGSLRRPATANSRPLSDPFKDPPVNPEADVAALQRRQEVQTWVEDWASAAESMNLERSTSKATNVSNYHSASSGDKSDRSNSNLSDRSNISGLSIQKSNAGTISRSFSQRSGSAGYALFSTAAAAVGRLTGRQDYGALDRSASKRSISTGDLAQMKARKRANSTEQGIPPPMPIPFMDAITPRDEASGNDYFTPPESPIKDYKNHSRKRSNSTLR